MDTVPVALAILAGEELRYTFANPLYRSLRPSGTHFIGSTFGEVFPRGARRGAEEEFRNVLRYGRRWKIRDFQADVEGRGVTWWEGECLPLQNALGEPDSVLVLVWEVTDRHIAEDALREREQLLRDVFENAGVSMWIEDFTAVKAALDDLQLSGVTDFRAYLAEHPEFVKRAIGLVRVVDVNQESLELFGATAKEHLTGTLARVFTPSMETLFADDLIALAEGTQSVTAEGRLRTLDGRDLHVLFTVRFHHGDRRYDHVVVTIVDITARKHAEEAMRESEERFRLMADSAPVLIWMGGLDADYTWTNQSWLAFSGRSLEQELGRSWLDNVHIDDAERCLEAYLSAAERQEPFEIEFRMRRHDGEYRWLVNHGRPRLGVYGGIDGFIGSCMDITELKNAEAVIRASEERYKAVVESQSEVLCRYRADGTILFVNGAYARMQAKDPEELVGRSAWDFVPEEEHEEVRTALGRMTPEHPEVVTESRQHTAAGTRWTLWTTRGLAFDSRGRLLEAQSSGIDISKRKQMEEELRSANRAKDEILGMVSHEFRTPLTSILGNIDILERSGDPPEQRATTVKTIRAASARLRRLVENMLVLARQDEDTADSEPEPLLLHRVLPGIIEADLLIDDSCPIELDMPSPLGPVMGNEGHLEQVLSNLFSNARRYGREGAPICVSTAPIDGYATIRVCNEGERLSAEDTSRFFEPFFRDPTHAASAKGVGLGLAVCRRLVGSMGGEISACPNPEGGLIIEFTLPFASDSEDA